MKFNQFNTASGPCRIQTRIGVYTDATSIDSFVTADASASATSASPELAAVSVQIIDLSDLASSKTCRGWSNLSAQGESEIAGGRADRRAQIAPKLSITDG